MQTQALKYFYDSKCRIKVWIPASAWIAGFIAGGILLHLSEAYIVSLMRMAAIGPVSIVRLIICNCFPLLFTAFAVYFSIPAVVELLLFFRAASFGYLLFGLLPGFGSGGWLIGILLLLPSGTVNVLLVWFYMTAHKAHLRAFLAKLAVCVSILFLIAVVDYLYISPFLVGVLEHF